MIFESTNPLTSRARFKSRDLRNKITISVLFTAVVAVMSLFVSMGRGGFLLMLLGDAIALLGARLLYLIWHKRPIRLRCRKCGKIILSNTPWVCGFCGVENRNADEYSFVDRCSDCKDVPKAYRCHHIDENGKPCGEIVFLSADKSERGYAYCLIPHRPSPDPNPEPVPRTIVLNRYGTIPERILHKPTPTLLAEKRSVCSIERRHRASSFFMD